MSARNQTLELHGTTARDAGGTRAAAPGTAPLLVRIACAGDLAQPSARWRLDGVAAVRVCRGDGAASDGPPALAIGLADPYASARHLLLYREDGRWWTLDEGSTNGTMVDGRRLAPHERRALGDEALLEVGQTFLLFRAAAGGWARRDPVLVEEDLDGIVGTLNPEWEEALAGCARLAPTRHELLLHGESGAGKGVLARWIHERSERTGPFLAVNCAALTDTLLDDELFGHVRGAYSGAQADRPGLFRAADGGTLFLDEVGDMSPALQAKLLRVVEDGRVRPLGSERDVEVDVRLLAATHRDLRTLVARGAFREDLLARLGLAPVRVPPLRERREDLGLMLRAALRPATAGAARVRCEREALRLLLAYRWPLNVRELQRVLQVAADVAGRDAAGEVCIAARHLPEAVRGGAGRAAPRPELTPEERAARERLEVLLRRHAGNVAAVARELGKPRTHVQRVMARLGVDRRASAKGGAPDGAANDG